MVKPQVEDGYTRIAHGILQEIGQHGINGTQRGIIDQVWRYSYGFKRKDVELSISFIASALKKTKSHVDRELTALIDRNIIQVIGKSGRGRVLHFNKDFSTWIKERRPRNGGRSSGESTVRQIEDEASAKSSTKPSAKTRTNKERKKVSKKDITRQRKTYAEDSTYFLMAKYFYNRVQKVAEAEELTHLTIKADLQKWADEFRKLVEVDKVDNKHLIRDVMNWVTTDSFWKTNVLSAKKFREKFSELAIKSKVGKGKRQQQNADLEFDARNQQIEFDEALREWVNNGGDPADFKFNP